MVSTHDKFSHQSEKDELDPCCEKEDGEQQQGVAMGLYGLKEFLVQRYRTEQ